MKNIFVALIFLSISAYAAMPENEAEFLYNHKDNSTVRADYMNQKTYVKATNDMYIRDDGVTINKNPAGIVETSSGKAYMPIGSGSRKMYVPMDL